MALQKHGPGGATQKPWTMGQISKFPVRFWPNPALPKISQSLKQFGEAKTIYFLGVIHTEHTTSELELIT